MQITIDEISSPLENYMTFLGLVKNGWLGVNAPTLVSYRGIGTIVKIIAMSFF